MPELSSATATVETAIPVIRIKIDKTLFFNFMFIVNLSLGEPLTGTTTLLAKGWSPNPPFFYNFRSTPAETVEYILNCLARQSLRADTLSVSINYSTSQHIFFQRYHSQFLKKNARISGTSVTITWSRR
jgi:hypothetical protein